MTPDRSISPLIRTKTAAQWAAENPYLHRGDLGIESDTGKQKAGLGARWSSTSYLPGGLPQGYEGLVLGYSSGAWQSVPMSPLRLYDGSMLIAPGASQSTTTSVMIYPDLKYNIDGWITLSVDGANNGYSPNPQIGFTGPAGNVGYVWWPMFKKGAGNEYALWSDGSNAAYSWRRAIDGPPRDVFAASSTGFNSGATLFIHVNGYMQNYGTSGQLGLTVVHADPTPTGNADLSVNWHLRVSEHG